MANVFCFIIEIQIRLRENESDVIVVDLGVDEEGALEIDAAEAMESDSQSGIAVHRLHNFGALVVNHPVGIDLRIAFRIQHHRLVCPVHSCDFMHGVKRVIGTFQLSNQPEIGGVDFRVVGTIVEEVADVVAVVIILAGVADTVVVRVALVGIVDDGAVVPCVEDAVVVCVRIAVVADAVVVGIALVTVGVCWTIVQRILNAVPIFVIS